MSAPESPRLRALILAGGQSSRMGSPKYLLPMPSNSSHTLSQPLLLHLIDTLEDIKARYLKEFTECTTISVRNQTQQMELKDLLGTYAMASPAVEFVTDAVADAGPAQGLLAAYNLDKSAHWLIVGCDYPLLNFDALDQLVVAHHSSKKAVTCFQNNEGFAEPLLSIWTPSSLRVLADLAQNVSRSIGPNQAIKTLQRADSSCDLAEVREYEHGVAFIRPLDINWIRSVDTRDQWKEVKDLL